MSGLVFEKLTQTLAAGQVWRLAIAADFFRIAAASWPVKVRILKAGRILGEMDGWQAGDFVRDVQFDAVEIEAGSLAQTVTVQIAGGGVGSDRVLGEVSVIDGAANRVYAGKSFSTYGAIAASPGNYPMVQLWNPAGSGFDLVVSGLAISGSLDGWLAVMSTVADLNVPGGKRASKLIGGPLGVAKLSVTQAASLPVGSTSMFEIFRKANDGLYLKMNEPFICKENSGIMAAAGPGITVSSSFDFYETEGQG